jgi:hypothetical protein
MTSSLVRLEIDRSMSDGGRLMCCSKPAMSCVAPPGPSRTSASEAAQITPETYESSSLGEVPPESQGVMCACKDDISCLTYRSAGAGESLGPVPLVCDGHGCPEKSGERLLELLGGQGGRPISQASKSPGHSYLTEAEAGAQPSLQSLLVVRTRYRSREQAPGAYCAEICLTMPANWGR